MIAAIGIGANLGDRLSSMQRAIAGFSAFGSTVAVSGLFLTKPWGLEDQPDFYNAVALVETDLSARELLNRLQNIEKQVGRTQVIQKWGPRVIDLDILLFGDLKVNEPDLIIPHPHMRERLFVIAPLAEVDSRFKHDANESNFSDQTVKRISEPEALLAPIRS